MSNVILVADDDEDILQLVALKLTSLGHQVVLVTDGVQALAEARSKRADLLVLDIKMPGLTGLEVTRIVRADHSIRDLPIVLLSALASEQDIAEGYAAGADQYVTKPFSLADLRNQIEALLSEGEEEALPPA